MSKRVQTIGSGLPLLLATASLLSGCMMTLPDLTSKTTGSLSEYRKNKNNSIYKNQQQLAELKCLATYASQVAGEVTRLKRTRDTVNMVISLTTGFVAASAASISAYYSANVNQSDGTTNTGNQKVATVAAVSAGVSAFIAGASPLTRFIVSSQEAKVDQLTSSASTIDKYILCLVTNKPSLPSNGAGALTPSSAPTGSGSSADPCGTVPTGGHQPPTLNEIISPANLPAAVSSASDKIRDSLSDALSGHGDFSIPLGTCARSLSEGPLYVSPSND